MGNRRQMKDMPVEFAQTSSKIFNGLSRHLFTHSYPIQPRFHPYIELILIYIEVKVTKTSSESLVISMIEITIFDKIYRKIFTFLTNFDPFYPRFCPLASLK